MRSGLGDEFPLRAELFERGFPRPDPTTGMYDLDEIDRWRAERHLKATLTPAETVCDAPSIDMGEKFRATQKRRRDDRVA